METCRTLKRNGDRLETGAAIFEKGMDGILMELVCKKCPEEYLSSEEIH